MRISRFWRLCSRSHFFPDCHRTQIQDLKYGFIPKLEASNMPMDELEGWRERIGLVDGLNVYGSFSKVLNQVYEQAPIYPDDDDSTTFPKLEKGMVLDSASFLSTQALRWGVSQSKYLMICCFHVPVLFNDDCDGLRSLIPVCSELRQLYGSDFEMLLVAKMRLRWAKRKAAFDHFFSAFPSFCRVVPFEETETHHLICKHLSLPSPPYYNCVRAFALLERSALQPPDCVYTVLHPNCYSFITFYGADWFPFIDVELKWRQFGQSWDDNFASNFVDFFRRKLSQLQVYKLPTSDGRSSKKSLSELQGKVVGIYLCCEGSIIRTLDKVYRQCKDRGLEFEVVLVYVPFASGHGLSINKFIELINEELYGLDSSESWWILTFTDSISRTLSNLCPDHFDSFDFYRYTYDRLVIVGPNGEFVDPNAAFILDNYGIEGLDSFTQVLSGKLKTVTS